MKCSSCSAVNSQSGSFCGMCGAELRFSCPSCGLWHPSSCEFCTTDGRSINALILERNRWQELLKKQKYFFENPIIMRFVWGLGLIPAIIALFYAFLEMARMPNGEMAGAAVLFGLCSALLLWILFVGTVPMLVGVLRRRAYAKLFQAQDFMVLRLPDVLR